MAKRRQFTLEFKARVVLDIVTGVPSQAEASRKHGLGAHLVAPWQTAFLERARLVFDSEAARSAEQARSAELEQVPGRVTLENEIPKTASTRPTALATRNER